MKFNLFPAFLLFLLVSQVKGETHTGDESLRAQFRQRYEQLQPLEIFGRVVDQADDPVAGAEVKVGWQDARGLLGNPDPGQKTAVITDQKGCWSFVIDKPYRAFVNEVVKEGYEFTRSNKTAQDLTRMKLSPETRFVIKLRKKGPTTFLMRKTGIIKIQDHPSIKCISLVGEKEGSLEQKVLDSKDIPWDFSINTSHEKDEDRWTFTINANEAYGGGLAQEDGRRYDAPSEGYTNEIHVAVPFGRTSTNIHFSIKTGEPALYGYLKIGIYPDQHRKCIIKYEAVVNPYGTRNLEYDEALDKHYMVRKRLETQAKKALREGRRAEKPDLKKFIEEAEREQK